MTASSPAAPKRPIPEIVNQAVDEVLSPVNTENPMSALAVIGAEFEDGPDIPTQLVVSLGGSPQPYTYKWVP